jgi:hypothetical protein
MEEAKGYEVDDGAKREARADIAVNAVDQLNEVDDPIEGNLQLTSLTEAKRSAGVAFK